MYFWHWLRMNDSCVSELKIKQSIVHAFSNVMNSAPTELCTRIMKLDDFGECRRTPFYKHAGMTIQTRWIEILFDMSCLCRNLVRQKTKSPREPHRAPREPPQVSESPLEHQRAILQFHVSPFLIMQQSLLGRFAGIMGCLFASLIPCLCRQCSHLLIQCQQFSTNLSFSRPSPSLQPPYRRHGGSMGKSACRRQACSQCIFWNDKLERVLLIFHWFH